ncbi:syntaxin 1.1 [Capsaspora owczarzaki ATCC 30864]|uniref:Syntaxin 1.1 n=1 Tax=Capsaspora owczarzaki (strain ATCC 30864) TaxID=595528 RepID=A0A0D2X4L7_CAPO3|nr:syntaxin 1.1 [Capsaspora owczarzaki ATCC 30864]KJE96279.1 syntaxin 1.1 [Capsaspora owczarzaki ATCC 30864]|eukprot:XP_004344243.1 syntaxin 1.1 [Capsaspora owczarzaki ATCC 30864]
MRNRLAELQSAAAESPEPNPFALDEPDVPSDGQEGIAMQGMNGGTSPPDGYLSNATETDDEQFMAEFFAMVSDVRRLMADIEYKIQSIETEHGQALAAISQKQSQKSSEQLEKLMQEVQVLANQVRKKLKEMDKDIASNAGSQLHDAGTRIKESQKSILSRKFVKLMNEYNEIQTQYKQKYRDRVKRQLKIVKPGATAEEVNQVLDSDRDPGAIFANEIMSHAEAQQALEDIQDRHKDIVKLEKSIRELHELFLDMAILVEQQGEMIDRIEFNVGQAADHVAESKKELKHAARYQGKARRKKIMIVILLIIAILIIILPSILRR